jgi:hypothetical protein
MSSGFFKQIVFGKKSNGGLHSGLGRTIYKLNFSAILKNLSANMENTLNGEKSITILHISANNRSA